MRLFYKHTAAHTPLALATIAEAQFLEAKGFVRQYREHLSDFPMWEARTPAAEWLVFPENVGRHLSLDAVAVRQGELYPVLTNNARQGRHGALVAIVKGPTTEVVSEAVRPIPEVDPFPSDCPSAPTSSCCPLRAWRTKCRPQAQDPTEHSRQVEKPICRGGPDRNQSR